MTSITAVCGRCGAMPHAGARFCEVCGTALAAPVHTTEYKQVTVLFADVVRSLDIASAVDPERLREIMTGLVECSAAVVRRYGGAVEYTGDGVMALFGAPVALEDHAVRACRAALDIQGQANRLATEVARRDGVDLRLRVGMNSGRVIAGAIGSGSLGYAATGRTVGLAQRMESVAPAGGVLLSESTAQLVERLVDLAEPEQVRIKGSDEPVCARRLLGIGPRVSVAGRAEVGLIGREAEMVALDAMVGSAIDGCGGVVTVLGPAGIGKSRVAREAAERAAARGVEVFWTFCEAHARDISFGVVARLLRAGFGVADLDGGAARARVREQLPVGADPQDLLLLDDLLGIADPDVMLATIDPDARRRRLTALINAASLARTDPTLCVIEDAHWIDAVSESMLADFLAVIPRTPLLVLITARPEYRGTLRRIVGSHTIVLAPLGNSDTVMLLRELVGSDPSVGDLTAMIAERTAGNPFFAEEMVRELAERGVLAGERGGYVCRADAAEVTVPPTVQATVAARIDRLNGAAKRTLNAAAVVGTRFTADLLGALGVDPYVGELIDAELVDQVRSAPHAEYAFRHPLIRAVAYESQLKSDRARLHGLLATAIEAGSPESADQNAALIAEHLLAAGVPAAAYGWHMRAGAWFTDRDIVAARISWERARRIADELADDDPGRTAMRIAPRTMLCLSALRVGDSAADFEELRELCGASGDQVSLAIGMTGSMVDLLVSGRAQEASRLAAEQVALLESIGDPTLMIGPVILAISTWFDTGEIGAALRCSQTVIDLAAGDATKGAGSGFGSPLAVALASRGTARWWLGRPGWREDLDDAEAMARDSGEFVTQAAVATFKYGWPIFYRVLRAEDSVVRALEGAARIAEGSSDIYALGLVKLSLAGALVHRDAAEDHRRGFELLMQLRDAWLRNLSDRYATPLVDMYIAREWAGSGDRDAAVPVLRNVVDELLRAGRLGFGVWGAGILVETLLERGDEADVAEARTVIERLADFRPENRLAIRDIWLLRMRALVARAGGDDVAYRDLARRYRDMAADLEFDGHLATARTMDVNAAR